MASKPKKTEKHLVHSSLRNLAYLWANQSALAAAGRAKGLGWRAVQLRTSNRDKAKARFLDALKNAMEPQADPDLLHAAKHALAQLRSDPSSPMTASELLLTNAISKAEGR